MRRLFTAFWFLPVLAAAGCTQTPKLRSAPPAPVIAKVAIPVPCEVAKIPKPDRPKRLAELTDPIWTAARLIVADHMLLEAYAKELEVALVDPCGPSPTAAQDLETAKAVQALADRQIQTSALNAIKP